MTHPVNPYMAHRLAKLAEVCMRAAGALEDSDTRTAEQWRRMRARLRYLLIAVSWRLAGNERDYGSPEAIAAKDLHADPRDVFAEWTAREQRALRYNAFHRCADAILGDQAAPWIRNAKIDGRPALDVAEEDDAGLRRALQSIPNEAKKTRATANR